MEAAKVKPWIRQPWPRLLEAVAGPFVVLVFVGYVCCEAAFGFRQESWFRKDRNGEERWFT